MFNYLENYELFVQIIADPIHGMMIFESYLVKIINHPYFQRLRHIKQVQGVEHVYPGGVHTRFSHSLGVCFLAGKVLDKLSIQISISDFDRKCVTISALCHDIGHGPFSHLYENISKEIDDNPCEHEARGMEITRQIIDDLKLFDAEKRESAKTVIGNMIKGKLVEDMTEEERNNAYLYQIVNNKNNGIDVDKWDYFIRDSHACGFPSNFDTERAISVLKVHDYHKKDTDIEASVLSFPLKDQINLYNMFNLRFTLHNKVYQHPVVKCVEEMIADVLKLADKTKILQGNSVSTKDCRGVEAIENYCLMDDRLVNLIHHANDNCPALDGTANNANNLKLAKSIIERIHCRDFYRCIYKERLDCTPEQVKKILEDKKDIERILENKIVQHLNSKEGEPAFKKMLDEIHRLENERKGLTENIGGAFRIGIVKVNYGNKDKNPIPNVYFYDKGGDSVIEYQLPEKSPMVPQCFEEVTIRVMCTLGKKHYNDTLEKEFKSQIDSVLAEFARLTKKRKLPIWS